MHSHNKCTFLNVVCIELLEENVLLWKKKHNKSYDTSCMPRIKNAYFKILRKNIFICSEKFRKNPVFWFCNRFCLLVWFRFILTIAKHHLV